MRLKCIFLLAFLSVASPAFAGDLPVPGPDAGIGLGAMALLGLGYAAMRKFIRGR